MHEAPRPIRNPQGPAVTVPGQIVIAVLIVATIAWFALKLAEMISV